MTQPPYSMGFPPPPPPPLPGGWTRMELVEGTGFALAYPRVPPIKSGPAIGAMIGGIGSLVVVLVELCLGLSGARFGWGALVAGAFAILAFALGAGATALGVPARRAIRASAGVVTGGGLAKAGVICGLIGMGLAVLGFAAALAATYA